MKSEPQNSNGTLPQESTKYLAFYVDGYLYAIDLADILQIVQPGLITPLPHTHPAILGVVKLRDRICPVMDLHMRLHENKWERGEHPLALLLEHGGRSGCIVIDDVLSVIDVGRNGTEPIPITAAKPDHFVFGHVKIEDKDISLLSVERLLDFSE